MRVRVLSFRDYILGCNVPDSGSALRDVRVIQDLASIVLILHWGLWR